MKKILILIVAFLFLFTCSAQAVKLGIWGGYALLMNDIDYGGITGVDETKGGVAFGGKLGLIDLKIAELGLLAGYIPLYNYKYDISWSKGEETSSDIPIVAYTKISLGGLFVMGGLGLHLWNVEGSGEVTILGTTTKISVDQSSSDLGVTLGAGYDISILEIGAMLNLIYAEGTTLAPLVLYAGLNFGL
ncbi:MAG: hypothetical protein KKH98_04465 [Spirochaetes bacterium]|nr:hypothetical protein [Spirochaetota bacterium]